MPLLDLNYGLLFNFPIFPLAVLAVVVLLVARDRRRLLEPDVVAALCLAVLLLVGVSETCTLYAHGGTPGISRYATWFIPLAIPFLMRAEEFRDLRPRWQHLLVLTAAIAAVWGVCDVQPPEGRALGVKSNPGCSPSYGSTGPVSTTHWRRSSPCGSPT